MNKLFIFTLGCLLLVTSSCSDLEDVRIPDPKKAYLSSLKIVPSTMVFDRLQFTYSLETTSTQLSIYTEPLYNEECEINGVFARTRDLSLVHGTNLITIRAYHAGVQDTMYTITVRCHDPRSDVRLTDLAVQDTVLSPNWSMTNTVYRCGKFHTDTIMITPVAASDLAQITIQGLACTNGIARPVPIIADPSGTNQMLRLTVVSGDARFTNSYSLICQYLPPEKESRLASILPGNSVLSPAFSRDTLSYQLFVSTNRITLTGTTLLPGQTMTIAGNPANSGVPVVFDSLVEQATTNIRIRVTSSDGTVSQTYTVAVRFDWVWSYTQVNYDFDGGIGQYLQKIPYSSQNGASYSTVTILTGIVTAANIAHSATYTKCFFIQDKNAGIYVYTSSAPSEIRTGNKVAIRATSAKCYYGMKEITSWSWQSTLSRYHSIYYRTGYYAQPECIGQVFAFSGSIWSSMDKFYVGKFDDDLYFHSVKNTDWETMLGDGQGGDFFGPISFSYDLYRMEIPAMEHIR